MGKCRPWVNVAMGICRMGICRLTLYTYVDIENVYNLLSLILHEVTDITILLVRSLSLQI